MPVTWCSAVIFPQRHGRQADADQFSSPTRQLREQEYSSPPAAASFTDELRDGKRISALPRASAARALPIAQNPVPTVDKSAGRNRPAIRGETVMKLGAAIAEIMKREGIEILCGYPVNHLIEHAANCRHPPGHGAPGAHRHSHGGRDLARHLGAQHRRVLHAARPRRRERHGRRGAMLRRIRARAGAADGLCAPARQYRPELQFQPGDAGVLEILRADQHRRRSLQHLSPRLHQAEERPRRTGDRRNPGRHVERGGAGAAELHAGAAHPLRRRSRACEGSRRAAGRRQAAGDLCRPGRALRQGLAAAEAARRTARDSRHHQPRRQVVVSGRRIRCRSAPAASPCRARCRNSWARPT